ncbi:hypothetical protein JKG47_13255 [Acidithiobacillus sp. MC6.1]|nr:hypothetical protein [Acidithiobacillus sp. MC6.1]
MIPDAKVELGIDKRGIQGSVLDISRDASVLLIHSSGQNVEVRLPDDRPFPGVIRKGAYGLISIGRGGEVQFSTKERKGSGIAD